MTRRNELARRAAGFAVLALPVAYGLAMFDDSPASTAAWAGMVIAAGAAAVQPRTRRAR